MGKISKGLIVDFIYLHVSISQNYIISDHYLRCGDLLEFSKKGKHSGGGGIKTICRPERLRCHCFLIYSSFVYSVWDNWGSWQCKIYNNGVCQRTRYRTCSTGNSTDCPGKNYDVNSCDKTGCPGIVYVFFL